MKQPLVVVALLAIAAPAGAQSRRYPPEPVDRDREQAARSELWESATNPRRTPYGKLIFEAEQLLRGGTVTGAHEAVRRLGEAVKLLPDEPRAYRLRGEAHLKLRSWAGCADDLASAWAREAGGDARQATELRRKLGLCQARAGRLADAERTLADAAVTGNATGEIWLRLGEVRIAMGKLEEAIAALEEATEHSDASPALIHWLLAGAYDRAHRPPAESIAAVREAMKSDRNFSTLRNDALPLLGAGEPDYLQGLAYLAMDRPRPDYALIYFRYFLHVAEGSPWRRRAEEHLRDLRTRELPETVERMAGNAALDLARARAVVRRAMPAMRACAAKTPFIIYEVKITKAGPRTPPASLGRSPYFAPPEGVAVAPIVGLPSVGEEPEAVRDAVARCIEPIASKLALPAIKEKDTYYRLSFPVVAP